MSICELQYLASLSLLPEVESNWRTKYSPPQTKLQLPQALPRLGHLNFGSCLDWDAMGLALWPLAVLAANSTSGNEGECGPSTACWCDASAAGSLSVCITTSVTQMRSMVCMHMGCRLT